MKRSLTATLLLLSLAGCEASGVNMNKHWSASSVPPRMQRFFLGYNADKDGPYREFQWRRKMDIQVEMRRYLLNSNPDNPNNPPYPQQFYPRPNWSPLPDPVPYVHVEGILLGLTAWGFGLGYPWINGLDWFPLPVDSIIGTVAPGGMDEFGAGLVEATSPMAVITVSFLEANMPGYSAKGANENIARVTKLEQE